MSEEEQKDICYEDEDNTGGTYGVVGEENIMDIETTIAPERVPGSNAIAPVMTGADLLASLKKSDGISDTELILKLRQENAELRADLDWLKAKSTKQPTTVTITKGERAYKLRKGGKRWQEISSRIDGQSLLLAKKYAASHNKEWPIIL